jgi:hypothetical protein
MLSRRLTSIGCIFKNWHIFIFCVVRTLYLAFETLSHWRGICVWRSCMLSSCTFCIREHCYYHKAFGYTMACFSLSMPWRWKQYVSPKHWYLPASPHAQHRWTTLASTFLFATTYRSNLGPIQLPIQRMWVVEGGWMVLSPAAKTEAWRCPLTHTELRIG